METMHPETLAAVLECPRCSGEGTEERRTWNGHPECGPDYETGPCSECEGEGTVEALDLEPSGSPRYDEMRMRACVLHRAADYMGLRVLLAGESLALVEWLAGDDGVPGPVQAQAVKTHNERIERAEHEPTAEMVAKARRRQPIRSAAQRALPAAPARASRVVTRRTEWVEEC